MASSLEKSRVEANVNGKMGKKVDIPWNSTTRINYTKVQRIRPNKIHKSPTNIGNEKTTSRPPWNNSTAVNHDKKFVRTRADDKKDSSQITNIANEKTTSRPPWNNSTAVNHDKKFVRARSNGKKYSAENTNITIQDIADDRISNDDSLALRPGQNDFFPDKDMPLQEDHEMKVLYKIAKTTTPAIAVAVIEKHLTNTAPEKKLRVLFLIDWILSTIGDAYPSHFGLNIASSFCHAYEQLTEKDRAVMLKLRQTWTGLFDPLILYDLDIQVKLIDPQWPVDIPSTSTSAVCPAEFPNSQANSVTAGFEAAICDVDPSQASIPPTIEPPAAASHKVFPMPLNEELDLMAGTFHEIQENKRLAKTTALQEHERKIQKIKSTNKRTRKEKKAKKAKRPF